MMIQRGCDFTELDAAFMMHGGPATQVDVKSLANTKYKIIFRGTSSHAAIKPEKGRSALDGLILAFQGIEFLREHVNSDVKMHYTVVNCGGTPANVVPAYAEASAYVRSYNRTYLDNVCERFEKVLKGAAMMTETEVEIIREKEVDNKIPVLSLNDIVMEQAKAVNAPRLRPAREKPAPRISETSCGVFPAPAPASPSFPKGPRPTLRNTSRRERQRKPMTP